MLNKKIMMLAILLLSLLAISAISAADNTTNDVISLEESSDIISIEKTQTIGQNEESNLGDPDSGTFTDLQRKIDNANASSTITLENNYKYDDGFNKEGILISKDITIDGKGNTIDGNKASRIFNVISSGVVFKNIIFINAHAEGNGGAISGSSTAINCTFKENYANGNGGAIYNTNAEDCIFIGNRAGKSGGAMHTGNAVNCNFTDNRADDDGGAIFNGSAINCTFTGNRANDHGGAIHHGDGRFTAVNCTFIGNSADGGGATYGIYVVNCIFTNNTSDNEGGAVYDANAVNCTFTSNCAKKSGGAMHTGNAVNCNFTDNQADDDGGAIFKGGAINCTFIGNNADDHGGAIHHGDGRFTAVNCTFIGNSADGGGATYGIDVFNCIFTNSTSNNEAGAVYDGDAVNCTFTGNRAKNSGGAIYMGSASDSIFTDNRAGDDGGAIFKGGAINCTFIGNNADDHGGAIHHGDGRFTAVNCTFIGNSADGGGATYGIDVVRCIFTNNTSDNEGGAVYDGDAVNCTFTGNRAKSSGGAMHTGNAVNCNFTDNRADDDGGAIFKGGAINCTFIGNSVKHHGGAMYFADGDFSASDCTFIGNSADGGGATYGIDVFNCIFTNNTSTCDGGAVYDGDAVNCTFTGNLAERDGGAVFDGDADYCLFTGNHVTRNGGAIYKGKALNSNFTKNHAGDNGGAIYEGNALNCTFIDNSAKNRGGAMNGGDLNDFSAKDCTFIGNTAVRYGGGATYAIDAVNCIFTNNTSFYDGGAMYGKFLLDHLVHVEATNCNFTGNHAESEGGDGYLVNFNNCNFINNTEYKNSFKSLHNLIYNCGSTLELDHDFYFHDGGDDDYVNGIEIKGSNTDNSHDVHVIPELTIDGHGHIIDGMRMARMFSLIDKTHVTLNNLTLTGGKGHETGGAIYLKNSVLNTNNVDFIDNSAKNGGAICVNAGSTLTTNNADFINNTASNSGGAICADSSCHLNCVKFIDNYAYEGGALYINAYCSIINASFIHNTGYNQGGAVCMFGGELKIDNGEFADNLAGFGGAISAFIKLISYDDQFLISITGDTKFINNKATSTNLGGGAICLYGNYHFEMEGGDFINNSVKTWGGAIYCYEEWDGSNLNFDITGVKLINNSAIYGGGAIYVCSNGPNTLKNSSFINNSGPKGSAIYAEGFLVENSDIENPGIEDYDSIIEEWGYECVLYFENNTINKEFPEIYVGKKGYVSSTINARIIDNTTYDYINPVRFNSTYGDDNDNLIWDENVYFLVGDNNIAAHYDIVTKMYFSDYCNLEGDNEYLITLGSRHGAIPNLQTSLVKIKKPFKGSFSDLAVLIGNALIGNRTLELPYDFAYSEHFDDEKFREGLLIEDSLYIDGKGHGIDGVGLASIFHFKSSAILNNIVFVNAISSDKMGGAIYLDNSSAIVKMFNCNFTNNSAPKSGGAIYANSELIISNSIFENNIANGSGSAIYANNNLSISDCIFTNNMSSENCIIFVSSSSDDSKIEDSTLIGNEIYAIVTEGNLTLDKNSIASSVFNKGILLLHENTINGTVYNYGKITDGEYDSVLIDGKTINTTFRQTVHPYATLVNHDNNAIFEPNFTITMNGESLKTDYDAKKRIYVANYTFDFVCERIVSTDFKTHYLITGKYVVIADVGKFNISSIESSRRMALGKNISLCISICDIDGVNLSVENMAVVFNSMKYLVNVINGTGSLNLGVLIPGNYAAVGIYKSGPYEHYVSEVITVTSDRVYCDISSNNGNIVGEEGSITVHLTNDHGVSIVGDVELIFTDSDGNVINKSIITASKDSVKLPFTKKLAAGSYNLIIKSNKYTFIQKSGEAKLMKSVDYIVYKKPTDLKGDDVIVIRGVDKNIVFTLTDGDGNPLSDLNVRVSLNGTKYYVTDENGQITISGKGLTIGEYVVNVVYGGNEIYTSSSTTSKVIVIVPTSLISSVDVVTENVDTKLTTNLSNTDDILSAYTTDESAYVKYASKDILSATTPYSFTEFQELINNAESGATITLDRDVVYDDNFTTDGIKIDKPLTIDGNNRIISGLLKSKIIFNLTADNIVLKNMKFVYSSIPLPSETAETPVILSRGNNLYIESCDFINYPKFHKGSAITSSGSCTLKSCNFTFYFSTGGLINVNDCNIDSCNFNYCSDNQTSLISVNGKGKINSCNFIDCLAGDKSVIYLTDNDCILSNCNFTKCKSDGEGGSVYFGGNNCAVSNCNFIDCNSSSNSAAIYAKGKSFVLSNSNFIECHSNYCGALCCVGDNSIVYNCSFVNCSANSGGGAIGWTSGNGTVHDSYFVNCFCEDGDSGGIEWNAPEGILFNCTFINCSSKMEYSFGGGVNFDSENGYVIKCTFIHCSAGIGGGISFDAKGCQLINSTFKGNFAVKKGNDWDTDMGISVDVFNVTVFNAESVIIAENISTAYGIPANLTITLQSEFKDIFKDKNIIIVFDGKKFTLKTNSDGQVVFPIPANQAPKTYDTHILFNGNDRYNPTNVTVSVTVTKRDVNISAIYDDDAKEIVATLTDSISRKPINGTGISIDFGGIIKNATTDASGKIKVSVSDLNPGKYSAKISSDESAYYKSANATIDIIIISECSKLQVIYDEDAMEVIATLLDNKTGKAIAGVNISVSIDHLRKNVTTDSKGKIRVSTENFIPGSYIVYINFEGNDVYLPSNATVSFTIDKYGTRLTSNDLVTVYGSGEKLVATLKDINGSAISMAEIIIQWDDVSVYLLSDGNGSVYLSTEDLVPGTYDINIMFEGNNIYEPSNTAAKITVEKIKTTLTSSDVVCDFDSDGKLIATLKDDKGNAIRGVEITVTLDGWDVNLISDINGSVYLSTDGLAPGSYKANITFGGRNIYLASNTTANVIINPVSGQIATSLTANDIVTSFGSNTYLIITLKDIEGKVLSGVKLSVTLKSTKIYTTDKNGKIKVSTKGLVPKTYTAKVTFAGDAIYLGSYKEVKVTVKKAKLKLTAKNKKFKKSKKVKKYSIKLKTNTKKALKKVKVTLKIKGKKKITAKTNSKGKATFKIKKLTKKGTYKSTVTFKGNKYYKKVSKKVKIKIK